MVQEFQTTADGRAMLYGSAIGGWVGATVVALIALRFSFLAFLIMESVAILLGVYLYFAMRQRISNWLIEFKGTTLYLTCLIRKKTYVIEVLTYSDFWFSRQSDSQKEKNIGSVTLRGTRFTLEHIENFLQFKQYIENNF